VELALGQRESAQTTLLTALALRSDEWEAAIALGNAYLNQGRPDLAEPAYRRAVATKETVYGVTNLGAALAKQGRLQEPQAEFERALRLDST
jgi:Tfp pilus assembly protein PilF